MRKFNVVCSNCGHKFGKYGPGSDHETTCPQCKAELKIETHENDLIITVLSTKQERQAVGQPA